MVDMSLLHPELQEKANQLITKCEKQGLKIRITQGYRTFAEQDALYAQGRTKPGNKVTNARGGYSMHNYGIAIDFCRNDGKGAYNDSDGFFAKVGKLGKSLGLEWGGDWKNFPDRPHLQLPYWGSGSTTLRNTYGSYEKFKATWKPIVSAPTDPDEKYGPILKEETFRVVKDSYLRSSPEVNKNKIAYKELSATLKKKCTNKDGYALFKAGHTFTRIRAQKDDKGNKWMQMKSNYWIPAIYDNVRRIESI